MPWVKEDFKSLKIFKQWGVYQNRYSRCGSSLHTSRFNQRWYQDENIFFGGDLRSISNTIPWHPKTMECLIVSVGPSESICTRIRCPLVKSQCLWVHPWNIRQLLVLHCYFTMINLYIYYICVCGYIVYVYIYILFYITYTYIFCQLKLEMRWQDPDIRQMNHYDAWLWDFETM